MSAIEPKARGRRSAVASLLTVACAAAAVSSSSFAGGFPNSVLCTQPSSSSALSQLAEKVRSALQGGMVPSSSPSSSLGTEATTSLCSALSQELAGAFDQAQIYEAVAMILQQQEQLVHSAMCEVVCCNSADHSKCGCAFQKANSVAVTSAKTVKPPPDIALPSDSSKKQKQTVLRLRARGVAQLQMNVRARQK